MMSSEAQLGPLDDPVNFIDRCKEFLMNKMLECEQMERILSQHPASPPPQSKDKRGVSAMEMSETCSRLSSLFDDDVADDAPLLASGSAEKSPHLLRPFKRMRDRRSPSPSPTRKKIQAFLAREYERVISKMGSRWRRSHQDSPSKRNALKTSPRKQNRVNEVITDILMEIEKIENDLSVLDGTIKVSEEAVKNPDTSFESKRKVISIISTLKNAIYVDYRHYVDKQIRENEEVNSFVESMKAEQKEKQPHDKSPSKKLPKQPLSKDSPKHFNKPGTSKDYYPSEASLGTPKRTKKTPDRTPEKKKKASPNQKASYSPGRKDNISYAPVPKEDPDDASEDTVDEIFGKFGL